MICSTSNRTSSRRPSLSNRQPRPISHTNTLPSQLRYPLPHSLPVRVLLIRTPAARVSLFHASLRSLKLTFRGPLVRLVRNVVAHDEVSRIDGKSEEHSVDTEGHVTGVPVTGVEAEGDGLGEGFLAAEDAAETCW